MCNINFNSGAHGFKSVSPIKMGLRIKNALKSRVWILSLWIYQTVKSLKIFAMTKQDWSYHAEMSLNGKVMRSNKFVDAVD